MNTLLDLRDFRKSYGARTLFDGVDLSVLEGEKVGVVGRNGSGKSTLFRILAGLEGMESGTLALRRDLRVGYLPQDPELDPEATIRETVAAALDPSLDEWDRDHRVDTILTRLGVGGWDRRVGPLSGGERRRTALARTLLSEPELLLLDEPTNHLDADTILWLEETLFDFRGAVLVVTHDRYFLDRVVDRIVEVSTHGLQSYEGGYTEYLEARAEREARLAVEEAKRLKLLEKELAWARRSPPARTGKQKARRARAFEEVAKQKERDRSRIREVELEMAEGPRLGRKVLEAEGLTKGYDGRALVNGFSDRLLAGERIGIVGPNGAGKTTLLRLLIGEESPDAGTVTLGENTRFGYFDQARELDPEITVARAVSDSDWVEPGGRRMHLKGYLDRFLFPPEVHAQPVRVLSGGERNRLLLARLFLEEVNLLILDEPTNDLDLDTLALLEDTLEEFGGCVLVVTHDRYLLDKLATSLLVFEGDGRIHRHHGGWDSYLARREGARAREEEARKEGERRERELRAAQAREQAKAARAPRAKLTFREERELAELPDRIEALEAERDELSARLADPAFYQGAPGEISGTTRRFQEVEEELERAYARWMELEEAAP